jgi:hypothetical protein
VAVGEDKGDVRMKPPETVTWIHVKGIRELM